MAKHRNFSRLNSGLTGRDHYDSHFSDSLERQVEWLRRGAGQKANAICKLLDQNNLNPSIILEVGCGTGAVIEELMRRSIGESYYALDYSDSAIKFIKETLPKVHAVKGDVQDCSMLFSENKFDFVICSHVVEHLEYPEHFLSSLVQVNWDYLIVEVPLENLLFGKIKGIFQDRGDHPAGHVQFFNRRGFLELVSTSGLEISDQYVYAPFLDRNSLEYAYGDKGLSRLLLKMCTEHYLPMRLGYFWSRFYHAHMSVLCVRKS